MQRFEHTLEVLIVGSRWLLAPFYLGLVLGIVLLLVKFVKTFVGAVFSGVMFALMNRLSGIKVDSHCAG